jgi:hypothetical protein
MTGREARAARNEDLFRRLNERLHALAEHARAASAAATEPLERFVCECASTDCSKVVELTRDEYEAVRATGTRFLVYPERTHTSPDIEDIVERSDRYWVVEKRGEAGDVVEALVEQPAEPL